jgi:N-acetylmuramoyl-L-alanine amidase
MRVGNIDRVKRQLLHQAVTDNVETIRGLPPRSMRPAQRVGRAWWRRMPVLLLPLSLLGASYLMSGAPAIPPEGFSLTRTPARLATPHIAASLPDSFEPVKAAAFPLAVKRVVLDAGHGGKDAGASSASLVSEKEITLDIERRLRLLLERGGFEVVATRTDDTMIPLRERARRANSSEGDIFVSIHVNSIRSHTISHGVETYYLGPTKDPILTQLAAEENGASGYSIADLRKLLDRVYADVRRDESRRLASTVQDQLYADLRSVDPGLENWGVKRAPFIVLVATEMPAVLAEVGCLSNEREAAMLNQPQYRQQIAQALFRGIHEYARKGT